MTERMGRVILAAAIFWIATLARAQSVASQGSLCYGPVTVSFDVQFAGDPFDPEANDVRVLIVDDKGQAQERIAYYDDGTWRARFVTSKPGRYVVKLRRNGAPTYVPDQVVHLREPSRLAPMASLETRSRSEVRLGRSWFGIGLDLTESDLAPLELLVAAWKLSLAGGDLLRVSPSQRLGLRYLATRDHAGVELGSFDPAALRRWDRLFWLCESLGVRLQVALCSADDLLESSAGWKAHPWNAANGGPLSAPGEFFSNADAARRFRAWIRHAIARWGQSPALVAFEVLDRSSALEATVGRDAVQEWMREMLAFARTVEGGRTPMSSGDQAMPGFDGPAVIEPGELASINPKLADTFVSAMGSLTDEAAAQRRDAFWAALRKGAIGWLARLHSKLDLDGLLGGATRPFRSAAGEAGLRKVSAAKPREAIVSGPFLAEAVGETGWLAIRLVRSGSAGGTATCELNGLGLLDGICDFVEIDLVSGAVRRGEVAISDFRLARPFAPSSTDVVLILSNRLPSAARAIRRPTHS